MSDVGAVKSFWEAHINNASYTRADRSPPRYFAAQAVSPSHHLVQLFERQQRSFT